MTEQKSFFVNVLLTITIVLFVGELLRAQTTPSATLQEPSETSGAAQLHHLDQLLKECGDLQTNAKLDDLERKATEALALSRSLGDKNRIARALTYLGSADFYRGRLQKALDYQKEAAAIAMEAGNKRYYATAIQNAGATLSSMGRFEEALYYLTRTLEIGKELNERLGVWYPLRNIGYLYLQLGDYDKAEQRLQEALLIARDFKNKPLEQASLMSLIELRMRTSQYEAAQKYCAQALIIDAEVKNPGLHYELLANAADVFQALGQHRKALEMYEAALKAAREIGHRLDEALILSAIGASQRSLRQMSEALDFQLRARAILREIGAYPDVEAFIDSRIAAIHEDLGQNEEALYAYGEAFRAIERIRAGAVPTERSIASVNASRRDWFVAAVNLLNKLGRPGAALDVAERYRARAFLDVLTASRFDLRAELTPAQQQREDLIFDRISTIQKELLEERTSSDRQQQLKSELSRVEDEFETLRLALRRENPRYASLEPSAPLSVEQVQKELLDHDTVLVEYLLGEKHSFVWAVSQKKLSVALLPARKEIESQVDDYRRTLTRKVSSLTIERDLTAFWSASRKLYSNLIQPLEAAISSSRKLLIVPDGVLSYLPFETLARGDASVRSGKSRAAQTMVERFDITYVPSASALAAMKSRKRGSRRDQSKNLLAFGDPVYGRPGKNIPASVATGAVSPSLGAVNFTRSYYAERGFEFTQLPNTRKEVLAIIGLYQGTENHFYLGSDAREETVKSEKVQQYRYLHFAAHALIDDTFPARSGVVLSLAEDSKEDGVLQMNEIMRLKLDAEMVTLSACSTGLGKLYEGEGIVGLTRAFLYAGADSVVVSLWNVSDFATAELMKNFYQNLNRGTSRAEALRRAKLSMMRSHHEWRHPYFWAPFVLVGQ